MTTAPMPPAPSSRQPSAVEVELETLIRARYPIIYVVSWEERRVEETLREICQRRGKKMVVWTATTGLGGNTAAREPVAALDQIMGAPDQSVFVLKDFHPFISDVVVTRRLRDLVHLLKTSYKSLIILSPLLKLPPELEKEITVVDYQLPTMNDLDRLLEGIIQSVRATPNIKTDLTPLEREQILKAASGLTSNEAENVFAKSLVQKRGFDIDVILGEKEQIIRKSGILEYYRASEAFSDVGGMDLLKQWMGQRTASFSEEAKRYGLPEPRGVLMLGVQGCGKSLSAKAIASLWRLPLLRLDVGKVFAGIVGSSEENMRKAIATAESVAPCVAGDTRITLADGSERTIQELYDGSETRLTVLGLDENFRMTPVSVQAVTRRIAPDLFTVQTLHTTLQATSNHLHPVLREGQLTWVRTDALQIGDYIAMPRTIPTRADAPPMTQFLPGDTRLHAPGALEFARPEVQTPQRRYAARQRDRDFVRLEALSDPSQYPFLETVTKSERGRRGRLQNVLPRMPAVLNEDATFLLGLIDSSGHLGKTSRVGFLSTDPDRHQQFREALERAFGLRTNPRPKGGDQASTLPCAAHVDNRLLVGLLRAVRAHLLSLPAELLRSYLRGCFDGGGYVSDGAKGAAPKVVITAKSLEQNQLLRSVLRRVGFLTTNQGSSSVEITGCDSVRRFVCEVGSAHPMRNQQMALWASVLEPEPLQDRADCIPVGGLLRQVRQDIGMGAPHFQSASPDLLHRYEHGAEHPNRERLQAIVEEMRAWAQEQGAVSAGMDRLAALVAAPTGWSPVLSVEDAEKPEFVYDLVCDKPNTFIANDLYTHNCVLWLDELEKGFAGTQSSPFSDGGTTSRVFGSFITWLQEKQAACFVVATSNDVSQLPPELMRKGRFDEIFFVDLPAEAERREIFAIHLKKRKRDPKLFDLDRLAHQTVGYSGAEIEQVVVAALYKAFGDKGREVETQDLLAVIVDSIPLSVTMSEGIERLREWAETRARPASSVKSEDMATIIQSEAADRYNQSPEAQRLESERTARQATGGDGAEVGENAALSSNGFSDRLEALERKTATGMDTIMQETQNLDSVRPIAPPLLPTTEVAGTTGATPAPSGLLSEGQAAETETRGEEPSK
ncbi:MAG: AAA family ATPase [Cytophagales bacterium]|nr:AAA family ATPase [Armatimonadota bacterium]